MSIQINYDFTTGYEKSYNEVKKHLTSVDYEYKIETHCLEFFSFDYLGLNSGLYLKNGKIIFIADLLANIHQDIIKKEIRIEHDIRKMLVDGTFNELML